MRQVCRGRVSNALYLLPTQARRKHLASSLMKLGTRCYSQVGNIIVVFLWGKKVINPSVVEGTPFSGVALRGLYYP